MVVVANRLPVRRVERDGEMHWDLSPGGLVSALTPVLAGGAGMWIGWPGGGVETVSYTHLPSWRAVCEATGDRAR